MKRIGARSSPRLPTTPQPSHDAPQFAQHLTQARRIAALSLSSHNLACSERLERGDHGEVSFGKSLNPTRSNALFAAKARASALTQRSPRSGLDDKYSEGGHAPDANDLMSVSQPASVMPCARGRARSAFRSYSCDATLLNDCTQPSVKSFVPSKIAECPIRTPVSARRASRSPRRQCARPTNAICRSPCKRECTSRPFYCQRLA